jgi:hypothetical protein
MPCTFLLLSWDATCLGQNGNKLADRAGYIISSTIGESISVFLDPSLQHTAQPTVCIFNSDPSNVGLV